MSVADSQSCYYCGKAGVVGDGKKRYSVSMIPAIIALASRTETLESLGIIGRNCCGVGAAAM